MDDREHVYDTQISPLVAQIVEIARANKIPLVMSFGMVDNEGLHTTCDTAICYGTADPGCLPGIENRYQLALGVIRGHSGFDTAAGLLISRHHAAKPSPPDDKN